jgi:hypothetical protein
VRDRGRSRPSARDDEARALRDTTTNDAPGRPEGPLSYRRRAFDAGAPVSKSKQIVAIQIVGRDLARLKEWAAKEAITVEAMLGRLIGAERVRRKARSE